MGKIAAMLLVAVVVVVSFLIEEISRNRIKIKDRDGKTVTRKMSDGYMPGDVLVSYPNDPFEETRHYLVLEVRENRDGEQYAKVVNCSETGDYTVDSVFAYMNVKEMDSKRWILEKNIYKVK
jgi:hypothetical protein